MNLIYSCIFFNEQYIQLITLLLKTYVLFGSPDNNTRYLIICNPNFKDENLTYYISCAVINGFAKLWASK